MARLFARIAALVLGISVFAGANAQNYTYTFYVGNTNSTSGCTVSTAAGPVQHVNWRLQATVTAGVTPQFGSVSKSTCSQGVFSAPSAVTSTNAIGLNVGTGGADVIEVQLPISAVGPTPSPREVLAMVAGSNSASDALITPLTTAKGILVTTTPTVIPTLGVFGALLLGLVLVAAAWYGLRRYAPLWPLSLLLVAGTAWAVAIVVDGQIGDWATVTPSTDPAGDVSQAAIDLRALYVTAQGSNGYLRIDVADLQNPPVANAGSATLLEDGNVTITLSGSDPGGAPLTFQIATPPTRGSLGAITPINTTSAGVLYTGNADDFGADSFTFTANNGTQTSTPATVAVTITPINDAPSFTATDPPSVNEGSGTHAVPGWASFDPGPNNESPQAALQYQVSAIVNPALFAIAPMVDASGTLSYELAANANGTSSFSVAVRDDGGTAGGGIDLSATQSFTISVNAVNAAPSFVVGGDVANNEDAGPQVLAGWATAIDDGDPEQTQALTFVVTANTHPTLFATGPTLDAISGDLSFTTAADANGSATITWQLSDDGGTANGGSDTSAAYSFTVTITAVNDAPSFTANDPPRVNEDSGSHSVPGWASFDPGPADEAAQVALDYLVSDIGNPALFTAPPAVDASGTLSYTLAASISGSSSFKVAVRDNGGIANGGVDLSATQTFTLTVNAINSAPSFVGGGDVASDEDAGAQNVAAWATAITDGDPEVQALTFNVTGNTNPTLFSAGPAVNAGSGNLSYTAASNASGSATITLTLSDDGGTANGGSDTSAPYNFTITVNAVNDAPTAIAKSHTTHSAIELEIVAASHTGELLEGAADADDPIGQLTAIYVAGSATPAGGQVTVTNASDGSFRYDPPGGYSGAGSFQFRICDDGVPAAPQQCSAATTVTFNITGPELYFIDDDAASGGDGGLNDPFDALSDLPAGRGGNDRIFVFAGSYPSAVHSFFLGEHLVGQGTTGAFDAMMGVVVIGNGTLDARPTLTGVAGDRPAINRIVMAGAHNAVMRGLSLSTASSESVFINGTSGVTVTESSAASSISGVNINNSGASAEGVTFTNVTSTGGVNGIVLNNLAGPGSFDFGAGSLTGNTGVSFRGTGTLATVTYAGSISKNSSGNIVELNGVAAAADTGSVTLSGALSCNGCGGVDVVNRDAGTITFSGTSKTLNTGSATAVNLDNNDAATIVFGGGGLDIDTISGAGFNASNGAASITVLGNGNSIRTGTGTGLIVSASTIGASGLEFASIDVDGNDAAPVNGIILSGTGASGGLAVTGSGTPGSGGTIRDASGDGISLASTERVSLSRMVVTSNLGSGIGGSGVHGFELSDSSIIANGDNAATDDSGVAFNDLTGTTAAGARPTRIVNTTIGNNHEFELSITNSAGSLADLQMSGNSISSDGTQPNHGNLFNLLALGSASMTLNLTSGAFNGNTDTSGGKIITGAGLLCDHSGSSGAMTCNAAGATFTNNNVSLQSSISGGGSMVSNFNGVTATGSRAHGSNYFVASNASGSIGATLEDSVVGALGMAGSGASLGFGVRLQNESASTGASVRLRVVDSTVQETASFNLINVNQGIFGNTSSAPTHATFTGNTLRNSGARAILVSQNNATDADSAGATCVDIASNAMTNIPGQVGDGTYIRLRRLNANSALGDQFRVRQTSNTDLATQNGLTTAQLSLSGTLTFNGGACALP